MKNLNRFLTCFLILSINFNCTAQKSDKPDNVQSPMILWYNSPAIIKNNQNVHADWFLALPLGNGRMGAMVFGGVEMEKIQLNEESIWGGYKIDRNNPGALEALPKIRELIFENNVDSALSLAYENITGIPRSIKSYQTLCDLNLEFQGIDADKVTSYSRLLSLDSAIATTTFQLDGKKYKREVFASYPDQVVVCRISCNQPSGVSLKLSMYREKDAESYTPESRNHRLHLEGQISEIDSATGINRGMKFLNSTEIIPSGGTVQRGKDFLRVENADELVILISAATSYAGRIPAEINDERIERAKQYSFEELKQRHVKDYERYFKRVHLQLNNVSDPYELTTVKRIENVRAGKTDDYLEELFFQYGRYLLISHSRPGDLPANLTGMWWGTTQAPWNGDYHININCQMNYWPAQVTNLPEMNQPFFDLVDSISQRGKITAQKTYGADGWTAHHLTDVFWTTAPADKGAGLWAFGGAWSVRQLFEHYKYSSDKEFLRERAYPLMKGAAKFMLDYLVTVPEGLPFEGKLVTNPSHSPENAFELPDGTQSQFGYGATMDIMIIRDLFNNCIESIDVLDDGTGFESSFKARLQEALEYLVPIQVTADGRIQEWIEDYKETEIGHRHISHLYSVFPADDINRYHTPELAKAAKKTLERRVAGNPNAKEDEANNRFGSFDSYLNGKGGTGWGHAHVMNLWARLGEGNKAHAHYNHLIGALTFPNLFGQAHRAFSIDCNHGGAAGVAEMLVQSHEGFIRLLPALPSQWQKGEISGLMVRGGFEVDIEWYDAKLIQAKILSVTGNQCSIFSLKEPVVQCGGNPVKTESEDGKIFSFSTEKGKEYFIKISDN